MNHLKIERYVAENYHREHILVVSGGKLTGDWGNVARHCFLQAVAAEEMADLLGLPPNDKLMLASVAACHDWEKRLQKKPSDFSPADKEFAQRLFKIANPNPVLMGALTPRFLIDVNTGKATFLQLVQFLIDDMAKGDEFVSIDERIDEVSARNPNPEPEVQEELGRHYWNVEREVGHNIEKMVYFIFMARRVPCDKSIEATVNGRLWKRFG